jgi:sulfite exporter TauE/SafE
VSVIGVPINYISLKKNVAKKLHQHYSSEYPQKNITLVMQLLFNEAKDLSYLYLGGLVRWSGKELDDTPC